MTGTCETCGKRKRLIFWFRREGKVFGRCDDCNDRARDEELRRTVGGFGYIAAYEPPVRSAQTALL